ncbi:hypothetical protein F5146DRAFT_1003920 [Armillaria mellea]|nr:hypothetical protein F5146DRAFT_1003920 [Armillaria mellea]
MRQEPMSAFIDLEASVNHEDVLKFSKEELTDFIEETQEEGDISNAAFFIPHLEKQVWLKVDMLNMLKEWLKEIPGGLGHHSHQGPTNCWTLGPGSKFDKESPKLTPKLFNCGAIELDGAQKLKVLKKAEEQYLWHGLVYEYDLLVRHINFSQVEMACKIPYSLVTLLWIPAVGDDEPRLPWQRQNQTLDEYGNKCGNMVIKAKGSSSTTWYSSTIEDERKYRENVLLWPATVKDGVKGGAKGYRVEGKRE